MTAPKAEVYNLFPLLIKSQVTFKKCSYLTKEITVKANRPQTEILSINRQLELNKRSSQSPLPGYYTIIK